MNLCKLCVILLVVVVFFTGCPLGDSNPEEPSPGLEGLEGGGTNVPYTYYGTPVSGSADGDEFFGYYSDLYVSLVMSGGFITEAYIIGGGGESVDYGKHLIELAPDLIISHNSVEDGVSEANSTVEQEVDTVGGASKTKNAIIQSGNDALRKIAVMANN
jgi:uncharacterized protein with FMN-binding domain